MDIISPTIPTDDIYRNIVTADYRQLQYVPQRTSIVKAALRSSLEALGLVVKQTYKLCKFAIKYFPSSVQHINPNIMRLWGIALSSYAVRIDPTVIRLMEDTVALRVGHVNYSYKYLSADLLKQYMQNNMDYFLRSVEEHSFVFYQYAVQSGYSLGHVPQEYRLSLWRVALKHGDLYENVQFLPREELTCELLEPYLEAVAQKHGRNSVLHILLYLSDTPGRLQLIKKMEDIPIIKRYTYWDRADQHTIRSNAILVFS